MKTDYIKRHADLLEESGKDLPKWAGLLITVLEKGEKPVHKKMCFCDDCRRKYLIPGVKS